MYKELISQLEAEMNKKKIEYRMKIEALESYIIPTISNMVGKKYTKKIVDKINKSIPDEKDFKVCSGESGIRQCKIINITNKDIDYDSRQITGFYTDYDLYITENAIARITEDLDYWKNELEKLNNTTAQYIVKRSYELYEELGKVQFEINGIRALLYDFKTRMPIS